MADRSISGAYEEVDVVLVDDAAEWTADQFFADRAALVADIAKEWVAGARSESQ